MATQAAQEQAEAAQSATADDPAAGRGSSGAPGAGRLSPRTWRVIRWAGFAVWIGWIVYASVTVGVPTGRRELMILAVTALMLSQLGKSWRQVLQVLLDWIPFTAALMLYDASRGLAHAIGMPLHEADAVGWEKALFAGHVPTVWLQDHLYTPDKIHWYDAAMTLVYTTHFLATPTLAAILWLRNRELWLGFTARIMALSVMGLVTYLFFPEAPPWMAARDHLIDPVSRLSARGWSWFHLGNIHHLLEAAQRDGSNPVAAMPSLHCGFATLIALTLFRLMKGRWRYLVFLYPLAMGFSLVYLGEHYVIVLIAGIGYALAADVAAARFMTWRNVRKQTSVAHVSGVTAGA